MKILIVLFGLYLTVIGEEVKEAVEISFSHTETEGMVEMVGKGEVGGFSLSCPEGGATFAMVSVELQERRNGTFFVPRNLQMVRIEKTGAFNLAVPPAFPSGDYLIIGVSTDRSWLFSGHKKIVKQEDSGNADLLKGTARAVEEEGHRLTFSEEEAGFRIAENEEAERTFVLVRVEAAALSNGTFVRPVSACLAEKPAGDKEIVVTGVAPGDWLIVGLAEDGKPPPPVWVKLERRP